MSLIMTVAPSSTQRRATEKPMPVPAAAVTSTVLPSRRRWPFGYGGAEAGIVRRSPDGLLRRELRLARQAESALGDDVALNLIGAGVNGVGASEQEHALQAAELVRQVLGDLRLCAE